MNNLSLTTAEFERLLKVFGWLLGGGMLNRVSDSVALLTYIDIFCSLESV